jgi:hypothetical protein
MSKSKAKLSINGKEFPEVQGSHKVSPQEQLVMANIWSAVMEGTAWCGWTDRARESLVQSVQDSVRWAMGPLGKEYLQQKQTLKPVKYLYVIDGDRKDIDIEWAGFSWAIRRNGLVLGKTQEWQYEPMPSSRDEDFFKEFRFETLEEAVTAIERIVGGSNEKDS